jgi:hypothetical protein
LTGEWRGSRTVTHLEGLCRSSDGEATKQKVAWAAWRCAIIVIGLLIEALGDSLEKRGVVAEDKPPVVQHELRVCRSARVSRQGAVICLVECGREKWSWSENVNRSETS